ncbi:CAP domain-containing protein [Oceanobacillus saliphilus]|uniref:CAP domain-containing protein n=1 Tax=Oceanobacillus saliphilus TaxID=2925834 RepID=UPI00201E49E2|nr:CAP domain-containing protein [Oceanobacillus saliphilus]
MFKKVGMVTALSAALLFGGAFSSNAEASADQNQSFNTSYKVYYSMNGQVDTVSENDIKGLVDSVLNRFEIDWKNLDWKSLQLNEKESNKAPENVEQSEQKEAPAEKQPVQEEKPAQEQPKAEAPAKQEPVKQEPVKEAPAKQEPVKQAPVKEEKPAEQPAAPVQQPVQKEEQPQKQEQSQQLSQFEQEVVELTNQERAKQGLPALKIDTELSKVAREKSRDMAVNNYFDHNSPTYGSPFDMMKSYGISYSTAGENIAKGQRTPAEVVNAWMNSQGHRENILNGNYTHIGVGYVEQGNHWTQLFIGK